MITEAVLGVLVDLVVGLVGMVQGMVGTQQAGNIVIPVPMAQIMDLMITAATAVYPAAFVWFVWRQVKA